MDEQLRLELGASDERAEPPSRLPFPLPADGGAPFDDDGRFFEPWWPGAHAFARRSGHAIELRTEHLTDPLVAFPALRDAIELLAADDFIVEGTLLALDEDGRPDQRLLRRCLAASAAPRERVEGAFVAADAPWLDGRSLARKTFVERRARLAAVLPDSAHCVLSRGVVGEGRMLGRAVSSMGIGAISARRLDGRWRSGPAGDGWLRLHVDEVPVGPTRPLLVLMQRLPLAEP